MNQMQLKARANVGEHLFKEGKIQRVECFRLEVDVALGRDSGPICYKKNTDYINNEM